MSRPRVLLAPVTVTPSKPLTPSHVKGLLWADVMFRATAQLADVTFRYSHTTYNCTEQTLAFWEFLDRTAAGTDFSALTEEEIGEFYVRHRAEQSPPSPDALRCYAEAVERDGWVHPASARILELWQRHYALLGMHDPGLRAHQPPGLGLEEMIEQLVAAGLGLDHRGYGGPVYLDATAYGLPLRQIVTPDGRPNYLACALRELLPLAAEQDEVVLLYDRELDPDYQLLERALARPGTRVHRVPIGRVPIEGKIASARHGGWQGHTASALLAAAATAGHRPAACRLGMRMYFIATLGPGQQQSFRHDLLDKCLSRAEQLLDRAEQSAGAGREAAHGALRRHRRDHAHVDPYRLTSSLLGRQRHSPDQELLSMVYL